MEMIIYCSFLYYLTTVIEGSSRQASFLVNSMPYSIHEVSSVLVAFQKLKLNPHTHSLKLLITGCAFSIINSNLVILVMRRRDLSVLLTPKRGNLQRFHLPCRSYDVDLFVSRHLGELLI